MLLISALSAIFLLSVLSFLYWKSHHQLQLLKKYFSKVEYQLIHERQKNQTLLTELNDLNQKFNQEILFDSLTGLPTRQVFEDRLSQTLQQSKRFQLTFAVIFLSVDEFNTINDVLGYDGGEVLLKEITIRLRGCIRQTDTLSYFSGQYFALLLSQLTKREAIIYVIKRIQDVLAQPFQVKEQSLFVTMSMGIAVYPIDGEESKALLKNADTALNQACAQGKNNFQFFQKEMNDISSRDLILTSSLRDPTEYRNITLYYRSIIDVKQNTPIGVQTILRWHHSNFDSIHSAEFLRLSASSGKMQEISEWIFNNALMQFSKWDSLKVPVIFVPVSLRQLDSSHFIYKISEIMQQAKIKPQCLVLEIFDDTFIPAMDRLEKSFNMLKHLGVKIAVARFGLGHLSLRHIQKLSIDYLMIDPALIAEPNEENNTAIKMILAIANSLQITVIAEGVENRQQQDQLLKLGCNIMQGPFFSPLLSGEDLAKKLTIV